MNTETFQNESLKAHNEYRKLHGVPPLTLNKQICTLKHSENSTYGENLYGSESTDPKWVVDGKVAVKKWYDEIEMYTFGSEPKSLGTGHFTQLIWKETKEMGVAFSRTTGKAGVKIVVVANYKPPGNFVGTYVENVPPPIADSQGASS